MSERYTAIWLPSLGMGSGLALHDRISAEFCIKQLRDHAHLLKEQAEAILSARDEDFHVETYIGVHVRKKREVIQGGK